MNWSRAAFSFHVVERMVVSRCVVCSAEVHSPQAEHVRSDWHQYNLKRKLASNPPIPLDKFLLKRSAFSRLQAKASQQVTTCWLVNLTSSLPAIADLPLGILGGLLLWSVRKEFQSEKALWRRLEVTVSPYRVPWRAFQWIRPARRSNYDFGSGKSSVSWLFVAVIITAIGITSSAEHARVFGK